MNRRGFLGRLAAACGLAAAGSEMWRGGDGGEVTLSNEKVFYCDTPQTLRWANPVRDGCADVYYGDFGTIPVRTGRAR